VKAADPVHGASITTSASVSYEALPWYERFRLLKVLVRLPHKPVLFRYADDGQEIVLLGTSQAIYSVNAKEGLRLAANQVPAYLRYFAENGEMSRTEIFEAPDEPRWLAAAAADPQMAQLKGAAQLLIHPVQVVPIGEAFRAIATAIEDCQLLNLVLEVEADGRVREVSRSVLLEDVPVPYLGI